MVSLGHHVTMWRDVGGTIVKCVEPALNLVPSRRVPSTPELTTLARHQRPVILLEGTRRLPDDARESLGRLARWLCAEFPRAVFRSGNAEGTDAVFASAVAAVDSSRLELVIPNVGMGRKRRPPGCRCVSLDELLPDELAHAADVTRQASPASGRLSDYYVRTRGGPSTPASGKGMYLLRDTIKVTGAPSAGLTPADFGVFYVDSAAPSGGGTGHTIRVCQLRELSVSTQRDWAEWAG